MWTRNKPVGLPFYLTASQLVEVAGPGHRAAAIASAARAFDVRMEQENQETRLCRIGADGVPRFKANSMDKVVGMPRRQWLSRLDTWLDIQKAEGAWR